MWNQFVIVKEILWLCVAIAISFAILKDFYLPTLFFVFLTLLVVLVFLLNNQAALNKKYLALEAKAAIPKANDKFLYGKHKPTVKGLAPWLGLLGLFSCYPAYLAANGDKPTRLAKIAYEFGGRDWRRFFLVNNKHNLISYRYRKLAWVSLQPKVSPNPSFKRDS